MKNIYKITKGQLNAMWVFGVIGFMLTLGEAEYSGIAMFLSVLIPAFLTFYTIGWKSFFKENNTFAEKKTATVIFYIKKIFSKKIFFVLLILIILGNAAAFFSERISEKQHSLKIQEEYIGSLNRYDNYLGNAQKCIDEKIKNYNDQYLAECKQKYNKAFENYNDCKRDMYWLSHNQCINWPESNYEEINCSEDVILEKIKSENNYTCYMDVMSEYESITSYEKSIVANYLESKPKTKSILSSLELQELYNLFPHEVFNEKTKDRINKIVIDSGYKME